MFVKSVIFFSFIFASFQGGVWKKVGAQMAGDRRTILKIMDIKRTRMRIATKSAKCHFCAESFIEVIIDYGSSRKWLSCYGCTSAGT